MAVSFAFESYKIIAFFIFGFLNFPIKLCIVARVSLRDQAFECRRVSSIEIPTTAEAFDTDVSLITVLQLPEQLIIASTVVISKDGHLSIVLAAIKHTAARLT